MQRLAKATLLFVLLAGCVDKKDEQPTPTKDTKVDAPPTATAKASTGAAIPPPTAMETPSATPSAEPKVVELPAPDDLLAPPADAKKTASGLVSRVLSKGTGKDHPKATSRVKVNYAGWTKDKHMFDATDAHGGPATFNVGKVIKGWTEGLQLMVAGEKRRFWIPAALAYGDHAPMGAPQGDLVFDVELLDILPEIKPPPVPPDVKAAPADATKTASGLAYKVLKKGTGTKNPGPTSGVLVHYTGWTTDGKMFDSSATEGEPVGFPLNRVIKGWTEGVQLMHVGDVYRFWIPGELAYGDKPTRPGAPAGMLVFEIELLEIK